MKLFHRTPAGDAILAEGFRNGRGHYLTSNIYEGVWLSNIPLGAADGAPGDDLLVVEIPEEVIAGYEWVDETSGAYREWLIPAELVNLYSVERCDEDEADDPEWEPDEAAIHAFRQRIGRIKNSFTK